MNHVKLREEYVHLGGALPDARVATGGQGSRQRAAKARVAKPQRNAVLW